MGDRQVELAIRIAADAADAVANLGDVGDTARQVANEVEAAAKDAGRSLGDLSEGFDKTATTAAQAAGGLGDVAGGLELVGFDGAAQKLQTTATAIQAVAGVADLATVATNLMSASKVKDTAATVANRAATIASSAATKAAAAAQWALNVAMEANPIGLIILAIVALVAGFVLLYKKSDTFRAIVNKVGKVGKEAIGWIVSKVGDLVKWVKDKAPAAWEKFKKIAIFAIEHIPIVWLIRKGIELYGWVKDRLPGAIDKFKDIAVRAFNAIPIVFLIRHAGDLYEWVKRKLPAGFEWLKDKAVNVFDTITAPLQGVIDLVQELVDWIKNIDWPDPPGWLSDLGDGLGSILGGRVVAGTTVPNTGGNQFVTVHVNGAVDPVSSARQLKAILGGEARRIGIA